ITTPGQQNPVVADTLTLFTSMFLHGGLAHLFGNMYFLYLFGDNVEEKMGELSFLFFYLATGLIAGLAHIATNPDSTVPAVGASGAISGVLGAYLVMFPRASIRTIIMFGFITVVDVSALFFLGFWFLGQLMEGVGSLITPEGVGIAFWAHIGGFVAGAILALVWPKDPRVPTEYDDIGRGFHRYDRDDRRWY
ncbi:MAG TPA: rhomboid family intramembrane serine protease, partial [bacterium]|nr:rhomboid family intramembrane serine protease [bacterium]